MNNEPQIGSVEWVKSLKDGELEILRDVINSLQLDSGWASDDNFNLEDTIVEYQKTLDREKLYRVGIALGIKPEKVNKTVGYLKGD